MLLSISFKRGLQSTGVTGKKGLVALPSFCAVECPDLMIGEKRGVDNPQVQHMIIPLVDYQHLLYVLSSGINALQNVGILLHKNLWWYQESIIERRVSNFYMQYQK